MISVMVQDADWPTPLDRELPLYDQNIYWQDDQRVAQSSSCIRVLKLLVGREYLQKTIHNIKMIFHEISMKDKLRQFYLSLKMMKSDGSSFEPLANVIFIVQTI